ncbi:MAG: hypothetical protein ACHQNE_03295 [Candidatus Kapaibacterium sp.]
MKYLSLTLLFISSVASAQSIQLGGTTSPLTKGASVGFAWNTAASYPTVGNPISMDTVHGNLFGAFQTGRTLLAGRTYYMDSDVIVPAGDTLLLQPGVTVIVLGSTLQFGTPEFQVFGTFISFGTKSQPNYLTVPANLHSYQNLMTGLWGGIACALNSGDLILKWTHIEYAGGAAGPNDPINKPGAARYGIWFENPTGNLIIEDSWITGSDNDPVRVNGGKISIFRNVFESNANTSGDGPNIKSGTVGDMAYNLFVGTSTNGPKLSNKGSLNPQTGINIYNNTIVTCGWRCVLSARAGSTDIEQGAYGIEYNNIIVNCRTGFRLVASPVADTADTYYDYQWYYGSSDSIVLHFCNDNLDGGVQWRKPHDKIGPTGANDPMFVNYNANQVSAARFTFADPFSSQLPVENVKLCSPSRFSDAPVSFTSDFHLASGSPCIGTAYTGAIKTTVATSVYPTVGTTIKVPMNAVTSIKSASNPYGADYTTLGLGKDFGAYQSDGSGNQQ